MKRNIYIAFTPYHIFLASMIALEYKQDDNRLVLIADFAVERIAAAVRESGLFSKSIVLPGLYKLVKHRNARRKKNAAILQKQILEEISVDRIFMGTDTRIETQAAAYAVKKVNPRAGIVVLEDGGDFYSSVDEGYRPKSAWRQWISKIRFGPWYEDVKIAGLYSASKEIWMMYPLLARSELQCKLRRAIDGAYCFSAAYRTFLDIYWRSFTEVDEKALAVDGVLMVTYSGYTKKFPAYISFVQDFCQAAVQAGMKIAVKYHPREESQDYCRLNEITGVVTLPGEIPAEVLYASIGKRLKWVVGDISSALMTAKWLLGESVNAYSVAPALKMDDPALFRVFEAVGVCLVENYKALQLKS